MMKPIQIPNDWTVDQVLVVIQFLDHLIDSIWCMYADDIKDIYRQGMSVAESLDEIDLFKDEQDR